MQNGYLVSLENNECTILDKKKNIVIAKIKMTSNKIFPLIMSTNQNVALKGENLDDSYLWYLRYGHLNYKGLKLLKNKNMVTDLLSINKEGRLCKGCVYGKLRRHSFPKEGLEGTSSTRASAC